MRETRPAHRPEGCRVHFLKLSATGTNHYIPKLGWGSPPPDQMGFVSAATPSIYM
ncbi:hypothetical protein MAHJHV51_46500 [Mycobacterium avium subsp. hominissuis]